MRNRKHQDILKEIELAVGKGITRITLLGQNVNAYKSCGIDFVELLNLVNNVKGIEEFGFLTSHPKDTNIRMFKAIEDLKKLKKYLHLPVQSGSDRILRLMNRGYTRKDYLGLVKDYRKLVSKGKLSTDIIVGFPSEREADFRETYNLIREINFDNAYIFKYSLRPHTKAANLPDDISEQEKKRRHRMILDLQRKISKKRGNYE